MTNNLLKAFAKM